MSLDEKMTERMGWKREPVQFVANEPQEISLRYGDGKLIDSPFGQKTMYSLTDGRVLFAEAELASKINFIEPSPGQVLWVTKHVSYKGKGKGRRVIWEVSSNEPGTVRRDGYRPDTQANAQAMGIEESDLERQLRESTQLREKAQARTQARENVARMPEVVKAPQFGDLIEAMDAPAKKPVEKALAATAGASSNSPRPAWYEPVISQTKLLVDALAEIRIHAERHGQRVSFDDCEKLLVTCLIGKQRERA